MAKPSLPKSRLAKPGVCSLTLHLVQLLGQLLFKLWMDGRAEEEREGWDMRVIRLGQAFGGLEEWWWWWGWCSGGRV